MGTVCVLCQSGAVCLSVLGPRTAGTSDWGHWENYTEQCDCVFRGLDRSNYTVGGMGLGVPAELVVEFQDAFASLDKCGNGMIPTKSLGALLRAIGENPSEAEIQDMMNEVDTSTVGTFKFPNFLAMMARKLDDISAEDEIRESFKVFDAAGKGFINRQELGYVMDNLGEAMEREEIEALVDEIDIDGDGQINYEEFYIMMSTK